MNILMAHPMKDLHREGLASHTYFDKEYGLAAVKLLPNEYFVTCVDMLLTSVLGCCVSACLCDPVAGVGGMNHFTLPAGRSAGAPADEPERYGVYAMDVLLAALEAAGARRERLQAKVFGGDAALDSPQLGRLGEANAECVLDYLAAREIPVLAQDLGGRYPRHLRYYAATGLALVTRVKHNPSSLVERERALMARLADGAIAAQSDAAEFARHA